MSKDVLDYFGELLITRIRDKAIVDWDKMIDGKMGGVTGKAVKEKIQGFTPEQIDAIKWMIPAIIDTTLHHLLWTLEQEESINIAVKNEDEIVERLQDLSDGLPGELYTEDGWIARFSKERHEED